MYLATVIDAYSRKLVGHALADHMRVFLVIEALSHARKVRGSLGGTFFILITAVWVDSIGCRNTLSMEV